MPRPSRSSTRRPAKKSRARRSGCSRTRNGSDADVARVTAEEEAAPASAQRPVRSYVLRQGRMSPAQTRALAELLPRFGIDHASAPLAFAQVFGRAAPGILEIGFGMGANNGASV